jgi:hypothetical protein
MLSAAHRMLRALGSGISGLLLQKKKRNNLQNVIRNRYKNAVGGGHRA